MIKDNLSRIRHRIEQACLRAGRLPQEITIVAVAKGRQLEEIKEAVEAGITDIGENRVQEALLKDNSLRPTTYNLQPIKWHMVGHLQTNKVKQAVRIFELIHSVDSLHLAEELDKQAARISKIQGVLIEVKTSPEATKSGLNPEDLASAIAEISKLKNLKIRGLMTIAPLADHPEKARPYFKMLKQLAERVNRPTILSMGMSDDFEVAIEEGATMLRIGRAIFEN